MKSQTKSLKDDRYLRKPVSLLLNIYLYIYLSFFFFKRSLNGSSRSLVSPRQSEIILSAWALHHTRAHFFVILLLLLLLSLRFLLWTHPPIGPDGGPVSGAGRLELRPPPPDPFAGPACAG